MRYQIIHETEGQLHIKLPFRRLTEREADLVYYGLANHTDVISTHVFPRTASAVVRFQKGAAPGVRKALDQLDFNSQEAIDALPGVSARATNEEFKNKAAGKIMARVCRKLLLPFPLYAAWTVISGAPYIREGLRDLFKKNFSAEIVHASAILASLLTGDISTASSIIFLTDMGEMLEEWTYKKSVDDLAQSLALNVTQVWKEEADGTFVKCSIQEVNDGDCIRVAMGSMIPLDGVVVSGEAMVNQAALTGESVLAEKHFDSTVFAGTVLEEGELIIQVRATSGKTRYDRIVQLIEESESMVSVTQSRAEKVVSRLIPYTFGASILTGLLTGNVTKAASVLMVDFSCAIEVAMPIAVLSGMREAGRHQVTVKGGKYLEMIREADTIVFDKTGTLTNATPVVEQVVALDGRDEDEMLALAACLEEHFPHSLANAVVKAAKEKGLEHEELHTSPNYIVAHGIVSSLNGERVVIGSSHFVLEDENAYISDEDRARVLAMPTQFSRLYMAIGGRMAAVIGISDPIRPESTEIIRTLRESGIKHVVMMTGDSERTAAAIAEQAGITEYYSEVLPEDKAGYVQAERDKGRKVIMIGDGINDSPALSAADVGIAIREGADIAREIADITLSGKELDKLVKLRQLSKKLLRRMSTTAWFGIGFNGAIMIGGITGLLMPGTAALLHNASTIGLCLNNMQNLMPDEEERLMIELQKEEIA
ncbi:MAG: heavy metal translocating P-type ATPase [Eubacterium sp.]|nr:heavy metal translocating P-type ATPase [Eubacterium sp.]